MAGPDDDQLFTARQLALRLGVVSAATLGNWTRIPANPLPTRQVNGRTMTSWGDVRAFVDAHQDLPAAAKARSAMRVIEQAAGVTVDREAALVVAAQARAAARHAGQAAKAAAERERNAAARHLDVVTELVKALSALDEALALALAAPPESSAGS